MQAKPRILIVDDEKIVCDMAKRSLEWDGYEVLTMTDSVAALDTLRQQRFDVVIADIKMKEVDGLQLLDFTNENWPDTKVIILTAFPTVGTAMENIHQKAFAYFTKPVRIKDLKASVDSALQSQEEPKEEKDNG